MNEAARYETASAVCRARVIPALLTQTTRSYSDADGQCMQCAVIPPTWKQSMLAVHL